MPPKLTPNGKSPVKGNGLVVSQPPSPAAAVAQNASKKKKKKKGKGKATAEANVTLADYPSRDIIDDDEDELPALEPCNGTQPSIPPSRTSLSADLESVHLSSTATLSASARGKPTLNMSAAQQAEFMNELYRKMEVDPATSMADDFRESLDALPGGMREFVQTALASMAGLGKGENEARQKTLYAIAEQMLSGGLGNLRSGLGAGNGGGGNGNNRATTNSYAFEQNIPDSLVNEFQRLVGAGRGVATAGQTQLQANVMLSHGFIHEDEGVYGEGDYSEDEVDEGVEEMDDMAQMRRSMARNTHYSVSYEEDIFAPPGAYPMNPPEQYDFMGKNKKKKKKRKNAEPVQPTLPPHPAPNPTPPARHAVTSPPPNPVSAVPPSSTPMPAPRTANPPPSSRAAGKQPMSYAPTTATTNSAPLNNPPRSARAAGKVPATQNYNAHNHPHHHPSPPSSNASAPQKHRPPAGNTQTAPAPKTNNKIWSTNTSEERERIKEFWLGLGEEDRRALVKIEKETVLKKMKEQQKHSCTCAVCGRKRHAIEEELEVLYDAYYEELEQYANYQQQYASSGGALPPPPGPGPFPGSVELDKNGLIIGPGGKTHPAQPRPKTTLANGKKIQQESEFDEDDQEAEEYEEDEYEDDEEEEDEEDEDDIDGEDDIANRGVRRTVGRDRGRVTNGKVNGREDLFSFGSNFAVAGPGNILTVADDLLKNDGQKFLEMMEQLAERRMQREEEAAGDIEDESEDEDEDDADEGEDEDDEEDEDEDEEEEKMTEEQKMEEGKRMFSIFAARMFEQRVLQAYREKVAQERQLQLLRELEDEDKLTKEKEAKKAKENQKKKDKKRQQKLAKEEEKAAKAAERAAEEAALKEQQRRQEEEQRKRREEERQKREALRKAQEEEKQKKEEERRRRLAEEKEREAEREKKRRDKKEKEEKLKAERREREEKERKAKEEREAKLAAEKAERERVRREQQEKEEREKRLLKEKEEKEKEAKERERLAAQQQQQRAAAAAAAAATISAAVPPFGSSPTAASKTRPPTSPHSSSASSGSSRQQPTAITPKKLLNRPVSSLPPAAPISIQSSGLRQQTRPSQQPQTPVQFSSPATPQQVQTPQYHSPTAATNLPPTTPIFSQNGPISIPLLSPRMQQYPASAPTVPSYSYGSVHGISGPSNLPRGFGAPPTFDHGIGRGLGPAAPIGPPKVGLMNSIGSPTSLVMPPHGPPSGLPPPIRRPSAAADTNPGPITRPTPIARPAGGEASASGSGSGTTSPSRRSPSPGNLGSSALAADDDEVVPAPPRRSVVSSVPVGAGWHSPRSSIVNAASSSVWGVGPPTPGPGYPSPRPPPWSATPIVPFPEWHQVQAQAQAQMFGIPYNNQTSATPPGS